MTQAQSERGELPRPPARRCRWLCYLALGLGIYVSGLATGWGLTVVVTSARQEYYRKHPEEMPRRLAERLQDKLDLNDKQTRQVQVIVTERWKNIQELRRDVYPYFKVELDLVEEQISGVLRPQQDKVWREYFADIRRLWQGAPPKPEPQTRPTSGPEAAASSGG